ncbi:MAG: ATP-binding protein [Gammaproteobacteria bacterium]|nr:ATP-binding protein [Gammaproteobacteria bacterium]
MKVINILGGPGIGKSTAAAKVFYTLKERGLNVELVTEVAKDIVYEEQLKILKDQLYVFAKQNRRMERLRGKVDYVVTDSPGILALAYQIPNYYPTFEPLVVDVFNSYNNINFMLTRNYGFEESGRAHDEATSKNIDINIISILEKHGIPYYPMSGTNVVSMNIVMDRILK